MSQEGQRVVKLGGLMNQTADSSKGTTELESPVQFTHES